MTKARHRSMRRRATTLASALLAVGALTLSGCTIDKAAVTGASPTSTITEQQKPNPTPPVVASSTPAPEQSTPAPAGEVDLASIAAAVEAQFGGQVGIALASPTAAQSGAPRVAGALQTGPAWSTAKVPIAVAVARTSGVTEQVSAAITASDNAAAEALFASLGEPATAAAAATQVLRDGSDTETVIQATKTRPEFSAFGQTQWSLQNQAIFGANLQCIAGGAAIAGLMGQIVPGQDYGLGTIAGARYKGGWGPNESGAYLTRQFGYVPGATAGTFVGVAIAAQPADGTYETGQAMLSAIAAQLAQGVGPGGSC